MNQFFKNLSFYFDKVIPVLVLASSLLASYLVFVAPLERVMGAAQKIMYVHVGSALACYLMLGIAFVSSICLLVFKHKHFYFLLDSASSISFLFCSIVLITGMIWGHSSWNTWWRWEPRLTSVLILWVLLFSIRYLSKLNFQYEEKSVFMASLGILSAIQVPVIMFSIKLLKRTEQLHPEVVAQQGIQDSGYIYALLVSNFALMFISSWLCRLVFRINKLNDQRLMLKRKF